MNGILPRPLGGTVEGLLLEPAAISMVSRMGEGTRFGLCAFSSDWGRVYPVGVLARLVAVRPKEVYLSTLAQRRMGLLARVEAGPMIKARHFGWDDHFMVGRGFEEVDPESLRARDYPVLVGFGWRPTGGFTEPRSDRDIQVTINGIDLEDGSPLSVSGNLGRLVALEQAHTIEHAIIRSLQQFGLCTPRTLGESIRRETSELKATVELGMQQQLPEVFGVTAGGQCGNPLTNLAHFYLAREVTQNLREGNSVPRALADARRRTLSLLAQDLELNTTPGLRALQGMKKGMMHDDSRPPAALLHKILKRFPPGPWA